MSLDAVTADSTPRIVKAGSAGPIGSPVAFNYADLRRACEEHIGEIQERSRRLLGDASADADRIGREAAEAGRRDGYREGMKSAEAEVAARAKQLAAAEVAATLETALPAIRQLADELQVEKERWVARWEGEAIRLATAIAGKVLRRAVSADPAAADRSIAETLRLAAGATQITVRISPADHGRLGGSIESLATTAGRFGDAEIVADDRVTPGGCLIETRYGLIDGRLEAQLDRIASELTG